MAQTESERLAVIEQILVDVRSDFDELRQATREDHHRLRAVEQAVLRMTESATQAGNATADRQRAIELRMQVLTAVVALAALIEPFLYHFAQH